MSSPPTPPPKPTPQRRRTLAALLLIGVAAAAPILMSPGGRSAGAAIDRCGLPPDFAALSQPLPHTAARLLAGGPLTIVALGSSSTEGAGATKPERSYPSRLAVALRARFPGMDIRVVNRGVSGELAPQMVARMERDVLAEKPDLVIWQLGTNSVLHDLDPDTEIDVARRGIATLKAAGIDVVLMDLQYAPAVLAHGGYHDMLRVLAGVARSEDVPLFHRFSVMRHWAEEGQMNVRMMLARDRLHMSDASYECLAQQIAHSIVAAAASRS